MATLSDKRQFLGGQLFGSTYIPKDADLSGKTIIVTGANTGIGLECAKHLARLNVATLILGCRSLQKGNSARDIIIRDTGCKTTTIEAWELDLASHQSVLAFAKRVRTSLSRLDAFIANAGVRLMEFTLAEGIETTITVNVISNMLLNIGVLPKLRETSVKYGIPTTLSVVGSMMHIFGPPESMAPPSKGKDTFDLLSDPSTADMGPRYSLSKTLIHALLAEFATVASRPGKHEQVIVNWVNPGWCASDLDRHKKAPPLIQRFAFAVMGRTAEEGSHTLVHAVVAGKQTHGCYLSECRPKPESEFLRSKEGVEARERLFQELMVRIGKISPETAGFIE
ncbi:NAD(P)-binding protein [Mollisia scopiformis]|uniref:NAD(P)-binding protein n=1 Tax=Mollisia scopiformis TaxID=149040 RepID=A0A194X403_MOLSC|nr:NAD(P)-binding protein [Mollisia scopiformis]KUJ14547.1 NAD(P)-binding protein [Mollisia scopiformis]